MLATRCAQSAGVISSLRTRATSTSSKATFRETPASERSRPRISEASPAVTSPSAVRRAVMAPPNESTWITDRSRRSFTTCCSSPGSARPEVSRMISPIRNAMRRWSPFRMAATVSACRARIASVTAPSAAASAICSQPFSRMIVAGSLSSANTASSTLLAIFPWMRRSASRPSSLGETLGGERGPCEGEAGAVQVLAHVRGEPRRRGLRVRAEGERALEVIGHLALLADLPCLLVGQAVRRGEARGPGLGQLGQGSLDVGEEGGVGGERRQVGLGEVAVVVRALLGPHALGLVPVLVPEPGLLGHRAAALEDLLLAGDLEGDGPAHELRGVEVLHLDLGPEPGTLGVHRHVGVAAQRPFLHVPVAYAEPAHQAAQLLEEYLGLFADLEIGLGDDLQERRARPVVIEQRHVARVDHLARVLLEVHLADAHAAGDACAARSPPGRRCPGGSGTG